MIWKLIITIHDILYHRTLSNDTNIRLAQDIKKSRDLLKYLVDTALEEWVIFNLRTEEEAYMSDEKREACLEWVIRRILAQSTPAIIDQVHIGYPAGSIEAFTGSIKDVALIAILNLSISQNTKDMEDNIPNVYIR